MLKIAGVLNFILAIAHLISLFWAKQVFEVGGIGKEMEQLAHIHPVLPYLVTVVVAICFFIFGLYAFSADGGFRKLPFLKTGIFGIAVMYILRAIMGLVEILTTDVSILLEICYSTTALIIGLLYLIGGLKKWNYI